MRPHDSSVDSATHRLYKSNVEVSFKDIMIAFTRDTQRATPIRPYELATLLCEANVPTSTVENLRVQLESEAAVIRHGAAYKSYMETAQYLAATLRGMERNDEMNVTGNGYSPMRF